MPQKKKTSKLHPRNLHQGRYDLEALAKTHSDLGAFIFRNEHGNLSVDFSDPKAVKSLNTALLKHHYPIEYWDFPEGYLCPPVPGRADYIHHAADLLASVNSGKIPRGEKIKVLDIGTGANLIYPILGSSIYGWNFLGTDLDAISLQSAQLIIDQNVGLKGKIQLKLQPDPKQIFTGVIEKDEFFDLTICNPPFHASEKEANAQSQRKVKNLSGKNQSKSVLNFGGKANELWCEGGEQQFIQSMIQESVEFKLSCFWFSSLVARESNLPAIQAQLKKSGATAVKTLKMGQGNKQSRIVAWTFLSLPQQENWKKGRWYS